MYSIRCTRKLLERLHEAPVHAIVVPTTALGDWYANVLNYRHRRLVHLLSARSLLSVLVPIRRLEHLVPAFCDGLEELLLALELPGSLVEGELRQMGEWSIARTASQSVLASMRDLALNARSDMELRPESNLLEYELELAGTPCGPLQTKFPDDETRQLLAERYG